MKRKVKEYNGVTLVALIITIIVILILAVVTISAVNNNGILNYAQNAKNEYSQAQTSEKERLNKYLEQLDTRGEEIKTVKSNLNKILSKTQNVTVYDEYGNKMKVPAGFKIIAETENYTAETVDITKGIVVEDEEGNQFVWIPVGTIYTNTEKTESKTIILGRYSNFTKNENGEYTVVQNAKKYGTPTTLANVSYNYIEYTTAQINAIAKNIGKFCTKANSSGGYYIGRYEARVENYDVSNISTSNSSKSTDWTGYVAESGKSLKLVSKANSQVWNYVTQNKASSLCQSMYTNKPYESDLVNSYAWDTAIIFFQEFGGNSEYASKTSANTGSADADGLADTGTSGTSYSGEKDVICNVYDMASNCLEMSTETSNISDNPCTVRGGDYYNSYHRAKSRNIYSMTIAYYALSFRPLLYM